MSGDLCTSCNMCCDGTLFDYVFVTPAERDRLGGGDDFHQVRGRLGMAQHCARQGADGRCSAYAIRPQKCIDFNCPLLLRHLAGEVAFEEALEQVAQAKHARSEAISACLAALPEALHGKIAHNAKRLMTALEAAEKSGLPLEADALARAKDAYVAFSAALDAGFRPPRADSAGDETTPV